MADRLNSLSSIAFPDFAGVLIERMNSLSEEVDSMDQFVRVLRRCWLWGKCAVATRMNSDAIAGTTSQWDCGGSMTPENGRKNAEVTHFHCAAHLEASFMRLNFSQRVYLP